MKNLFVLFMFISAICIASSNTTKSSLTGKFPSQGVRFLYPKDGDTLPTKFVAKFGVWGKTVAPAGTGDKNTGHHHVLILNKTNPEKTKGNRALPEGKTVPTSKTAIHFGKGQTETELKLKPGLYELTLQFADRNHITYDPKIWSHTISVKVKSAPKG